MIQTKVNVLMKSNRWTMRDFITLAIFNVVMLVILTVSNTIFHQISYLVGGGVVALINGPIYMVMAHKISKPGVLFLSSVITGLYFAAFGFFYYLIVLVIAGLLCELAMMGRDSYKNAVRNALGYGIYYVGYSLCGVVPILFFRKQYVSILEKSYTSAKLKEMLYYFSTPSMVITMCAISFVGAMAGCLVGSVLLKKHVKKGKLL